MQRKIKEEENDVPEGWDEDVVEDEDMTVEMMSLI